MVTVGIKPKTLSNSYHMSLAYSSVSVQFQPSPLYQNKNMAKICPCSGNQLLKNGSIVNSQNVL
jgi:hypothetical protein